MKRDVVIDGLLSVLNAGTGENNCSTVVLKLVLLITNHSHDVECGQVSISFTERYYAFK